MTKKMYCRFARNNLFFVLYSVLFVPVFADAEEIKQADESNYWAWGVLLFGLFILWAVIKLYQAQSAQDKAMRDIFSDEH